ncbi:mycothione reductase [Salininema proteolyticum]|uniref:Mycothione reductase n=1 Tax=Salininema proteolyticum TaxID=1607685 RepID=A0ABV8TXD9_9ACTN
MRHFDLIVIGSGSGNTIVDKSFADWNVAIVDRGVGSLSKYGGTCLNVGCIPTKMLVYAADVAVTPAEAERLGVDLALNGVDWPAVRDRVFGRTDPIADGGKEYRAHGRSNATLYDGTGRFTAPKVIEVDGQDGREEITAEQIVVAAGSRPTLPPVPGLEDVPYHTSDSVMRIDELPRRMVVLGTGFVAAEMAHVFSAFGVEVTIVGRSDRMLRVEDRDVSRRFTELAAERWDYRPKRTLRKVARRNGEITLSAEGPDGPEEIATDLLLVATGRRPNSDVVSAEAGGLATDADGLIEVDEYQRTSVEGVWALGDVSSPYQLKHVANGDARVVRHNLLNPESLIKTMGEAVPHAVFSHPQIASVGMTEQRAEADGVEYVSAVHEYADVAYGWAMEDTTGFAKILAHRQTRQILGAHIMGPQASNLIQPLIQAMAVGTDVPTMARGQYWIHPALAEVVENALLKVCKD